MLQHTQGVIVLPFFHHLTASKPDDAGSRHRHLLTGRSDALELALVRAADLVVAGLVKTGRLVTCAGLVMFAAFMGFVAGSIVGLQQFGFALAAAVLIDVTIVRAVLVPAFGRLGSANGDGALGGDA